MNHKAHLLDLDFISVNHILYDQSTRERLLDVIFSSLDSQTKQDVPKDKRKGLIVRTRVTHAGRLTGHRHLYLPENVRYGLDSFTKPFGIPVLAHHDVHNDPIGRVIKASYIPTQPAFMSDSEFEFLDTLSDINKTSLKRLNKILGPHLENPQFEGLGYVEALFNIIDKDAIEKIVDGRYHTVSVQYEPAWVKCSVCGADVMQGICEHMPPGTNVDGKRSFIIFGPMRYVEVSYVNVPADNLAFNVDITKDSLFAFDHKFVPSSKNSFYIQTQDSIESISSILNTNQNNIGDAMKFKLKDIKANPDRYELLAKYLPEDKILDKEKLEGLQDSDFIGAGRLFPAVDEEHLEAVIKLLDNVYDCKEKEELLDFAKQRLAALDNKDGANSNANNNDSNNANGDGNTDEKKDVNAGSQDEQSQKTDALKITINGKLFEVTPSEDGTVAVTLSKDDAVEILKQTLPEDLKAEDALTVINSLFATLPSTTMDSLKRAFAGDIIAEFEDRVNNYKNEIAALQKRLEASGALVSELDSELKDFYIEKILSYRDKLDPQQSEDSLKAQFKDMSLTELRASYKTLSVVMKHNDTISPDANIKNDNIDNKDDNSDDHLQSIKAKIIDTYRTLYVKDSKFANQWLAKELKNLEERKQNNK